jgi:hypothetical protein
MHFSSFPCVLHANYEATHYTTFTFVLLPLRSTHCPQYPVLKHLKSMLFPQVGEAKFHTHKRKIIVLCFLIFTFTLNNQNDNLFIIGYLITLCCRIYSFSLPGSLQEYHKNKTTLWSLCGTSSCLLGRLHSWKQIFMQRLKHHWKKAEACKLCASEILEYFYLLICHMNIFS